MTFPALADARSTSSSPPPSGAFGKSWLPGRWARNLSLRERIEIYSCPEPNTGCWLWLGAHTSTGYGSITVNGKTQRAHRVAYEAFVGAISAGLEIDHLCRTPACVNPAHLEPVTPAENKRRFNAYYWGEHAPGKCLHGHDMTPQNTYMMNRGRHATCKTCIAATRARSRQRLGQ